MELENPTAYYSIVIPVIMMIFKSLLGDEIRYWLIFMYCYFNRPFDVDRNPDTPDWAMIFNRGNGNWECCSLTFRFGLIKQKSGVYIHYYDEDWRHRFTQRVSFEEWRSLDKAKLSKFNLPSGLQRHLNANSSYQKGRNQ